MYRVVFVKHVRTANLARSTAGRITRARFSTGVTHAGNDPGERNAYCVGGRHPWTFQASR